MDEVPTVTSLTRAAKLQMTRAAGYTNIQMRIKALTKAKDLLETAIDLHQKQKTNEP